MFRQLTLCILKGCYKLDRCECGDREGRGKVCFECLDEMLRVKFDIYKHIKGLDLGGSHGKKAGVPVVDQEVTPHRLSGVVIHTARAIGDVTHDTHRDTRVRAEYVCQNTRVHQETLEREGEEGSEREQDNENE